MLEKKGPLRPWVESWLHGRTGSSSTGVNYGTRTALEV